MTKITPLLVASILLAISIQAQTLSSKITTLINVRCPSDSNGSAAATVYGGFPPYTYLWMPSGQTTDTAIGLHASIPYTVTVTDSAFDTSISYITLTATSTLGVSTSSSEVSCFGLFNGRAAVFPYGGSPPYHISWLPGGDTSRVDTALSAGTYTSTTTDLAGCTLTTPVLITQPAPLSLTAASVAGLATAYASGGTLPYTFSWSPGGATAAKVPGLAPGTYTVTVNDSNFCTNSAVVIIDTTIITFSFSDVEVDCHSGIVSYKIMASSSPPTYFNSAVLNIKYTGGKFLGDSVIMNGTWGSIIVQQFIGPFFPLTNTNLSDSVLQIVMSDTTYTPTNEKLLDSVPQEILGGNFMIQSGCQPGTLSFTNEWYTGPTCYHTLFTKVLDYTDTVSVETIDSLYNPHTCDSLCNPYLCNEYCCNYDQNNSCIDSCYDICYNTCPYTCYDTARSYITTIDSFFTTYSKNFPYNTAAYMGGTITIDTICLPSIDYYTAPINAGVGSILTIGGGNFGGTRGTGRVEFIDADNPNYYIGLLNNEDYISWTPTEIKIRLPANVDSFPFSSSPPVILGGGDFKVINSCGDSGISGANPPQASAFSIYYNINQSWNQAVNQKNEVLLRNIDGNGGYILHLNPISFPAGSIQRLIFAKAMRDWTCYTGMNWSIGSDTIINFNVNVYPPPETHTNYVFFTDSLPTGSLLVARTPLAPSSGCTDSIIALKEGDMYFNSAMNFVYDSTGTVVIDSNKEDFYAVCLHELGHFMQLNHTTGDTDLMYWTEGSGPIAVNNRMTLASGKARSAIAGALYSITQSAITPVDCNGYLPLIPLSKACLNTTAVKEIAENNTFVVYPNPSNGTFTIDAPMSEYNLSIRNMLGQMILSRKIKNQKEIIDISNVANGMYFIQEQYSTGISTQKLIITK